MGETSFAQGVIHTVPPQPLYYNYLLTSRDIDMNNDGVPDFVLSTPDGLAIDLTPLNNNAILSVLEPQPDIGAFIYALPPGAAISSSLNPAFVWFDRNSSGGSATIVASSTIGSLGFFQGNTDAYAGVRPKYSTHCIGLFKRYSWEPSGLTTTLATLHPWAARSFTPLIV